MYAQYIHLVTHELPELYPACHMNSYYSSSVFLCKYSGGKKVFFQCFGMCVLGKKVLHWIYCTLILLSQLLEIKAKLPLTGRKSP